MDPIKYSNIYLWAQWVDWDEYVYHTLHKCAPGKSACPLNKCASYCDSSISLGYLNPTGKRHSLLYAVKTSAII